MNGDTIFIYESAIGKIVFQRDQMQFWLTEIDGASSVDIDISESRSSGQVGASVAGQSVQPRSFTVDGCIFEPLALNRAHLLNVIAPQTPATLTILQGGESWYLDIIPEKTPEVTPGEGIQHFQTRLHAPYPYWRTTASYATQIAGLVAMFEFPFFTGGSWWISKYSDSFFRTVENKGNVPIEFQLMFTARSALSNPEVYHVDTGKKILIRKNMIAGERVVVSTVYGQKGVICISNTGEITNGFKYLSLDSDLSMTLVPGSNLLRMDASKNREGLGVRIESPEGVKSGV